MATENLDLAHKNIAAAMEKINQQFGPGSIINLVDQDIQPVEAIPTGALTLDLALGIGGLPRGRVVEIYGKESSGKTTLALSVCAEAQKMGLKCLYIDAEHALDPIYAQAIGVVWDDLYVAQPGYGEEAFTIAEKMINTGQIGVVVVDSVAALTPLAEIEAGMEDSLVGVHPRMMNKGLRKISAATFDTNTLVIFINQLRQNIGYGSNGGSVTPGGKGMKYFTSVRLDLWSKKLTAKVNGKDQVVAITTHATIAKNKVGPPYGEVDFDIRFGKGLDKIGCIIDVAAMRGILGKSGNWYSYGDDKLGNGKAQTVEFLASDLDLLDEIKQKILAN